MLQSPWLSLAGRRSGGVWGKWQSICTLASCSACCLVFLPALFSDALLFFFLLTLLLYQNFRCKLTSDLICWAVLKSCPQEPWNDWWLFWENGDQTYFLAVRRLYFNIIYMFWNKKAKEVGKGSMLVEGRIHATQTMIAQIQKSVWWCQAPHTLKPNFPHLN